MAIAHVQDGKVVDTSAANNTANASKKNGNTLGKDAFLQLLVAQMKYQDPLEPTSNTEYVSQLATFSELEEMRNLNVGMDLKRAQELVGKQVIVNNGVRVVGGKVDMVIVENGKPYLSINDELYSLEDLDSVADPEYLEAYELAESFIYAVTSLPSPAQLTANHAESIAELRKIYDDMTPYQKSFIGDSVVKALEAAEARIKEVHPDYRAANGFKTEASKLPKLEDITLDNEEAVVKLRESYDALTDVQKDLAGEDTLKLLTEAEKRIKELKEAGAGAGGGNAGDSSGTA